MIFNLLVLLVVLGIGLVDGFGLDLKGRSSLRESLIAKLVEQDDERDWIEAGCVSEKALPLSDGITCLRKQVVKGQFAYSHVFAMASVISEFYVFAPTAVDPSDCKESNKLDFKVWDGKIDVVHQLVDLALSFMHQDQVPVYDVLSQMNEIEIALRDAHVSLSDGAFAEYNGRHSSLHLGFTRGNETTVVTSFQPVRRENGTTILSINDMELKFINGIDPMQYVLDRFINTFIIPLPSRGTGSRVNKFFDLFKDGFHHYVGTYGNLSKLEPMEVVTIDDQTFLLEWYLLYNLEYFEKWINSCGGAFLALYEALAINPSHNLTHTMCKNNVKFPTPNTTDIDNTSTNITSSLLESDSCEYIDTVQAFTGNESQPGKDLSLCRNSEGWLVHEESLGEMNLTGLGIELKAKCFQDYCVLFGKAVGDRNAFRNVWTKLIEEARSKGITKLIVDVNQNGGGNVYTVYSMIKAFYPKVKYEQGCQKLDQPIGRVAKFLVEEGLLNYGEPMELLTRMTRKTRRLQRHTKELVASDCKNFEKIEMLLSTLDTFLQVFDILKPQAMENAPAVAQVMLAKYPLFKQAIADAHQGCLNGTLKASMLRDLVKDAPLFDPISSGEDKTRTKASPYSDPQQHFRGGKKITYTAKYFPESCQGLNDDYPEHPFLDIRVLTNGYGCGSSCDSLSTTPYMIFKQGLFDKPTFQRVGWGGTGEDPSIQNLTATSFPGGTNGNGDRVSALWIWRAIAETLNLLSGSKLLDDIERMPMPLFPAANVKMPQFSKMERYQTALGKHALPSEFYVTPVDAYLPNWYYNVKWGTDDAKRVYDLVFFAK